MEGSLWELIERSNRFGVEFGAFDLNFLGILDGE
jgi:hypothetical protein